MCALFAHPAITGTAAERLLLVISRKQIGSRYASGPTGGQVGTPCLAKRDGENNWHTLSKWLNWPKSRSPVRRHWKNKGSHIDFATADAQRPLIPSIISAYQNKELTDQSPEAPVALAHTALTACWRLLRDLSGVFRVRAVEINCACGNPGTAPV